MNLILIFAQNLPAMKFNWVSATKLCSKDTGKILDLEYVYRRKITQILLLNNLIDCCDDAGCYVFDIDTSTGQLSVSTTTPEPYFSLLQEKISTL